MESFVFPASWETEIKMALKEPDADGKYAGLKQRLENATVTFQTELPNSGLVAFAMKCHDQPSVFSAFPWHAMKRLNAEGAV